MARDLRTWLASTPEVVRISDPLSVRHQISAVQHAFEKGPRPPLLFTQPVLQDGSVSALPVLNNVTARRDLLTRTLELPERRTAAALCARLENRHHPQLVAGADLAEVRGLDAGVPLPVLWQHECDPGPYLTAAHATTVDPDSGIDNTAVQRVWVQPGGSWPYFPYPSSHNRRNIEKWWARGEDAPIALWIGHHPAVLMGAQAKVDYPMSHWPFAGALLGEPLRVTASVLHGPSLVVPADAEVVIEGFVPRNLFAPEGPFGEFTGYAGESTQSPVIRVEHMRMRPNAIYHDFGSGLCDALVPDDLLIEARLFEIAAKTCPEVLDVHVPSYGRRFWAYVETRPLAPEAARALLRTLLAFRRTKFVILFDEGVDLHDPAAVLEVIGTRSQPGRDLVEELERPGSALDPSLPLGETLSGKLGIDATWNGGRRPASNRVPAAASSHSAVLAAIARAGGRP